MAPAGATPRLARAASLTDVTDAVRDAARSDDALRLAGAGTWLNAGRPVRANACLDLSGLRGIIAYTPGDLTLTALAGTPLTEIAAATREHGQWLPLDPFGAADGTLGATLATGSAGPLAASVGRPRDVALGVGFIAADGSLVHGGGRVVKNVAGFDLVRLSIGAWGTLGVMVEATVRLRGLPHNDTTLALTAPDDERELDALLRALRAAPVTTLAAELINATLAARIGLSARPTLLVRIAGNGEALAAQGAALRDLPAANKPEEVSGDAWTLLARSEPAAVATFRLSRPPAELAALWTSTLAAVGRISGTVTPLIHATVERGIVRCVLPDAQAAALGALATHLPPNARRVAERLPADAWPSFAPGTANEPLSRRLRAAFDPAHLLNPGILGEDAP